MPLDRPRFFYSLSGALLAGAWNKRALSSALIQFPEGHRYRWGKIADRVVAAFPEVPPFIALAEFLLNDRALVRQLTAPRRFLNPAKKIPRPPPLKTQIPQRLRHLTLPELLTENDVAEWLGISVPTLQWLADLSCRNRHHASGPLQTYRHRWIPKKEGLPRLLEIPKHALKIIQRRILEEILNRVPAHDAAHGFRPRRSILTNAALHCQKPVVLRFDLADFFPSVTAARIFQIFRTLGYSRRIARLLMGLCTTHLPAAVWESRPNAKSGADFLAGQRLETRHLPQGAPSSPALANLAAMRLDRRLARFATSIGATYTRYADDLAFSGEINLARSFHRIETLVAVIAHDEGFTLNFRKSRRMRAGARQQVAGVIVNVRPNLPRAEFDRLKAILTNCAIRGPTLENREARPDFRAHLTGKIAHAASINPARGERLMAIFQRIQWAESQTA